jgi:hypothetical protein
MSISSISTAVALPIAPATTSKTQASPALQASKPVAPPAVQSGADSDGDNDGSGSRINVTA